MQIYECAQCELFFDSHSSRKNHVRRDHQDRLENGEKHGNPIILRRIRDKFRCPAFACPYYTVDPQLMHAHLARCRFLGRRTMLQNTEPVKFPYQVRPACHEIKEIPALKEYGVFHQTRAKMLVCFNSNCYTAIRKEDLVDHLKNRHHITCPSSTLEQISFEQSPPQHIYELRQPISPFEGIRIHDGYVCKICFYACPSEFCIYCSQPSFNEHWTGPGYMQNMEQGWIQKLIDERFFHVCWTLEAPRIEQSEAPPSASRVNGDTPHSPVPSRANSSSPEIIAVRDVVEISSASSSRSTPPRQDGCDSFSPQAEAANPMSQIIQDVTEISSASSSRSTPPRQDGRDSFSPQAEEANPMSQIIQDVTEISSASSSRSTPPRQDGRDSFSPQAEVANLMSQIIAVRDVAKIISASKSRSTPPRQDGRNSFSPQAEAVNLMSPCPQKSEYPTSAQWAQAVRQWSARHNLTRALPPTGMSSTPMPQTPALQRIQTPPPASTPSLQVTRLPHFQTPCLHTGLSSPTEQFHEPIVISSDPASPIEPTPAEPAPPTPPSVENSPPSSFSLSPTPGRPVNSAPAGDGFAHSPSFCRRVFPNDAPDEELVLTASDLDSLLWQQELLSVAVLSQSDISAENRRFLLEQFHQQAEDARSRLRRACLLKIEP